MDVEILVPISLFAAIFGIIYVYLSTRNRERLALIEKGVDAGIFMKGNQSGVPMWKILVLNLAFLLMGIGLGVFIASLLSAYTTLESESMYPAVIFFMAGLGLYTGFKAASKLGAS